MATIGDYGPEAKLFALLLAVVPLALLFTPLGTGVHFLVPTAMQLVLCLWWAIALQLESL